MNPLELAKQLGESLLASEDYQKYQHCKSEMENSAEAMQLVDTFQNFQQELLDKQRSGTAITDKKLEELRHYQEQMLANKKVSAYLAARQDVDSLLAAVNDTIARITGMQTGSSCSGECGGDCSCL